MRVNPRKYGRERRGLLEPFARSHQLDYSLEVISPGSSPSQIAFQLVGCGADLLSGLMYPDAVPTPDPKVAKTTAKLVARRFRTDAGRRAAVFLAQAMATWFVEMMSRAKEPDSARVHARLGDLIQEFFALDPSELAEIQELRAEYRVMDDHDTTGRLPATGWYVALADPEFAEGRDVDTDPELIDIQSRYASRYLRLGAECRAIAITVGDDAFQSIDPDLFYPHWPGYEILEYDLGDMSWWNHCAELWHEAGQRALSAGFL
jgi:hypothetical protein